MKLVAKTFLVGMLFAVSACNTVKGIGEDIEAGGRILTETAEDVQEEVTDGK